jgi:hypothetical protein
MPSVTLLASGTDRSVTSYVTSSFTPPDNCVLVVICGYGDGRAAGRVAPSISGGGLSWTSIGAVQGAQWDISVAAWYAEVTSGSSMTTTLTQSVADAFGNGVGVCVYAVTGYDTSDPIGLSHIVAVGTSYNSSYAGSFGGTPAGTSKLLVVGYVDNPGVVSGDITAGSGYTSDVFLADDDATHFGMRGEQSNGLLATTANFSLLDATFSYGVVGIEVKIASPSERFITIVYY